jgi:hypothetical protein
MVFRLFVLSVAAWVLARLRALNLVRVQGEHVTLTERGEQHVETFIRENLAGEKA